MPRILNALQSLRVALMVTRKGSVTTWANHSHSEFIWQGGYSARPLQTFPRVSCFLSARERFLETHSPLSFCDIFRTIDAFTCYWSSPECVKANLVVTNGAATVDVLKLLTFLLAHPLFRLPLSCCHHPDTISFLFHSERSVSPLPLMLPCFFQSPCGL